MTIALLSFSVLLSSPFCYALKETQFTFFYLPVDFCVCHDCWNQIWRSLQKWIYLFWTNSFPLQQTSLVSMTLEDSVNSIVNLALGAEGERGGGRIAEEYVIHIRTCIWYICGPFVYLVFRKPCTQRSHLFAAGSSLYLPAGTEKLL